MVETETTAGDTLPNSLLEHLSRPTHRSDKPKGRGACPTFFVASCREACRGGSGGYRRVGHQLVSHIASLEPDWLEVDEWVGELEKLQELILDRRDALILEWFERFVPRCMTLIPAQRRDSLLSGVYEYAIEGENDVTG